MREPSRTSTCTARSCGSGGLIAFHDILPHPTHPDVKVDEVWNEVKGRYRHLEFTAGPNWGGIGVLWQEQTTPIAPAASR